MRQLDMFSDLLRGMSDQDLWSFKMELRLVGNRINKYSVCLDAAKTRSRKLSRVRNVSTCRCSLFTQFPSDNCEDALVNTITISGTCGIYHCPECLWKSSTCRPRGFRQAGALFKVLDRSEM